MPRSLVILVTVAGRPCGRDLLLSSRAGEVPTRTDRGGCHQCSRALDASSCWAAGRWRWRCRRSPRSRTPLPPPQQPPAAPATNTVTPSPSPSPSSQPRAGHRGPGETDTLEMTELDLPPPPPPIEYPSHARRDPFTVGALDPLRSGLGSRVWGAASGPFLSTPDAAHGNAAGVALAAYRAAQCADRRGPLRRAGSIRSTGPPSAPGCCCGWARPMPRGCWSPGVDTDRFTPKMVQVAVQSALANSDPAGHVPADRADGQGRSRGPAARAGDVLGAGRRAGERGRADRFGAAPRPDRRHRPGARAKGGRRRVRHRPRGDGRMGAGRRAVGLALRPVERRPR